MGGGYEQIEGKRLHTAKIQIAQNGCCPKKEFEYSFIQNKVVSFHHLFLIKNDHGEMYVLCKMQEQCAGPHQT
jgi:hypothetical protein